MTLTLQVTATKLSPLGKSVSRTLQERFSMAVEQSKVFDYAYFVNSFGILKSGTINGNAYFNGDAVISRNTDSGTPEWGPTDCVINGTITAAANATSGAFGSFSLSSYGNVAWPHTESLELYRDRQQSTPLCRPTSPADDAKTEVWPMGFVAEADPSEAQRNEGAAVFEIPYLSDLNLYKGLATSTGGTVTYPELVLKESAIAGREEAGTESCYDPGAVKTINGVYSGAGPSGVPGGVDAGCVMMYGTAGNPIVINGPVVVEGDLIIGGVVTGRGCFYAGRNIHFVDDITYADPPNWSNSRNDPVGTAAKNATKDLVGFCAKGLITVGPINNDPMTYANTDEQSPWDFRSFMAASPTIIQANFGGQTDTADKDSKALFGYYVDKNDSSIGYYPKGLKNDPPTYFFNGNYYQPDGYERIEKITIETAEDGTEKQVITTAARQFYEPTVEAKYVKFASLDMTHIDGVLFTNHAILGGRDNFINRNKPFTINGAYVTRNQAMNMSPLSFNWDIRLGSESKENLENPIYLPMTIDRPRLLSWHEVRPNTAD